MTNEQLRKTLQDLHAELEETQGIDPDTQAMLQDIDRHIQTLLARPDRELSTRHHGLTAQLRDSLARFEASNPNLVVNVERVLDAFNEMGI